MANSTTFATAFTYAKETIKASKNHGTQEDAVADVGRVYSKP